MENTINTPKFKSFANMLEVLNTDTVCREYLENILWKGTPVCPHCGCLNENHYKLKTKGEFKGLYKCRDCRERFTVTVGTMFENSHISLRKWFIAIYIFSAHKKGVSSHQLARDLGITQKTAWFMLSRIRFTFKVEGIEENQEGEFQIDESFFGGKNKNRHKDKKIENSQGRSVKDKTPVMGILNDEGKVHLEVVPNTKAETLKPIIEKMVKDGSIVITDEWSAYIGLSKKYSHVVLNHQKDEYVRNGFHNNGIENFWSLFKRGIYGIYHSASSKHLHRYCSEFSFRYNTRKITDAERFDISLKIASSRLTYKQLIAN
jgi:transposase-like protein